MRWTAGGASRGARPWKYSWRQAERSDAIITQHALGDHGQPGERWDGKPPATLERVLFHVLQEYARHLGHLDIVAELAGGPVGE
jgi:hypothetical protein